MYFESETNSSKHGSAQQSVDLNKYADKIADTEDRSNFEEAVNAANSGHLSSAFNQIWLTIAESLKSRLLYQINTSGIKNKGKQNFNGNDRAILDHAKINSIISENTLKIFNILYELRSVYSHPNGKKPNIEDVYFAAANAVSLLLFKPIWINLGEKEGELLHNLLENLDLLRDEEVAIKKFAKEKIFQLDKKDHTSFFEYYWTGLEKKHHDISIKSDDTLEIFVRRGIWFSQVSLLEISVKSIFNNGLSKKIDDFEYVFSQIYSDVEIFKQIDLNMQNRVLKIIYKQSLTNTDQKVLKPVELLAQANVLSVEQKEGYTNHIKEMQTNPHLDEHSCNELIKDLMSQNWNIQNPAIQRVLLYGPSQINKLDNSQQIELGRNILQTAEGDCHSANYFMKEIKRTIKEWPTDLIHGMAIESFVNESLEIRIKDRHLGKILYLIGQIKEEERTEILNEIIRSIDAGKLRPEVTQNQINEVLQLLRYYPWAIQLLESIKNKSFLSSSAVNYF